LYKITYKKAELKWKQGFRSTKEELIKIKCNEFINKNSNMFTSPTTTTTNVINGESYHESEFNEVDTSFFTYGNDDIDKSFNDTITELNQETSHEEEEI
jgi:hypothetical protein